VYMGANGKLQNKPVAYSLKGGGEFTQRVLKKY